MEGQMIVEKQGFFIKKIDPSAMLPSMGSEEAAGYDIYALSETSIPPKGKGLVSTGIEMAIPFGTYARIAPRSGLSWKNFIDVGAGVIDSDYRGEVKVLLFNFGDEPFKVSPGDRVAQIIIENVVPTSVQEVTELPPSKRGADGFGSTGVSTSGRISKRIPGTLSREENTLESMDSAHKEMVSLKAEIRSMKRELVALKLIRLRENKDITLEEKQELSLRVKEDTGLDEIYKLLEGFNSGENFREKVEEFFKK